MMIISSTVVLDESDEERDVVIKLTDMEWEDISLHVANKMCRAVHLAVTGLYRRMSLFPGSIKVGDGMCDVSPDMKYGNNCERMVEIKRWVLVEDDEARTKNMTRIPMRYWDTNSKIVISFYEINSFNQVHMEINRHGNEIEIISATDVFRRFMDIAHLMSGDEGMVNMWESEYDLPRVLEKAFVGASNLVNAMTSTAEKQEGQK